MQSTETRPEEGLAPTPRPGPRVLLISHAYSNVGNRPQLDAFAAELDIRTVTPYLGGRLLFAGDALKTDPDRRIVAYPQIPLFGTQFLLRSLTLGLRDFKPDIVSVTYEPWAIAYWQSLLAVKLFAPRARIVCGVKKNTYRRYPGIRGRLKRALTRLGLSFPARIVAASEMTAEMYERELGVPRSAIEIATRVGVDTVGFAPAERNGDDGPLVVGYCGRFSKHKGVTDLIAAVGACRDAGLDLRLRLVGDGELEGRLDAMAAERDWLEVLDALPLAEVADFMRTLDLYVLPARNLPDHEEHDGHALLQALACGLPTIGTRSGIIPELLEDGCGELVDPEDVPGLERALRGLASEPERRAEMRAAARSRAVARYSVDAVARSHAAIYRDVASRP